MVGGIKVKGTYENEDVFVSARKPRAEARSVYGIHDGSEHGADTAIAEKDNF